MKISLKQQYLYDGYNVTVLRQLKIKFLPLFAHSFWDVNLISADKHLTFKAMKNVTFQRKKGRGEKKYWG